LLRRFFGTKWLDGTPREETRGHLVAVFGVIEILCFEDVFFSQKEMWSCVGLFLERDPSFSQIGILVEKKNM